MGKNKFTLEPAIKLSEFIEKGGRITIMTGGINTAFVSFRNHRVDHLIVLPDIIIDTDLLASANVLQRLLDACISSHNCGIIGKERVGN